MGGTIPVDGRLEHTATARATLGAAPRSSVSGGGSSWLAANSLLKYAALSARSRRMAFHTLAEFVATILIMLIASGTAIGGMFVYFKFKLRAKELEAQDSREAEALLAA